MKKIRIMFLLVSGFVMIFSGLTYSQEKPILVGSISSTTGAYTLLGEAQEGAIKMAIDDVNATGGVLGRKFEYIHEDDEMSPAVGTRKIERLILEKKVDFCIGAISSPVTLGIMEVVKKYNKILMACTSQSMLITKEKRNKQTFRTCHNPELTAGAMSKWMTTNLGKNIYLLILDNAWGRSTSEEYHKSLNAMKANIVGETFFPVGTKDFAPYFGKIKAAKPDVLFVTAAGNDAIAIVTQTDQYGLKKLMHICADDAVTLSEILGPMGNSAEGIVSCSYYTAGLETPKNKEWVERYKKRFGILPSRNVVSPYESIMWLAQAIKKVGSVDTDKVIAALEGSTYEGPQGIKVMDPVTHQTSLNFYMTKVVNGVNTIFAKVE